MASVHREIEISVPAAHAWDALRDVGALHTRLVPGFVIDTKLEPGARLVTFANGRVVREWIVDVDDTRRRVAWSVKDEPFQHHNASARVFFGSEGAGQTRSGRQEGFAAQAAAQYGKLRREMRCRTNV